MRVLLVNDWTQTGGGVERYVTDVRDGLRAAGDDVRLLAANVGDAPAHADVLVRTSERQSAQALLQVANPFASRAARRLVRSFRPNVALVSMFEMRLSPTVVPALRPVPVVLNVGYYKPICPTGTKLLPDGRICHEPAGRVCMAEGCVGRAHWARDRPRYAAIRRVVAGAAGIVTCSEHMRVRLAREGISALHAPWPTAPVGQAWARSPSADPVLLYAGRVSREKGVVELVHAFAAVAGADRRARLEIVGDGPELPRVRAAVAAHGLGDRVALRGWRSRDALDVALARAWAVVVPSLWDEPLGLVALEAIVRGVPVIASGGGGLVELVEHERTGLLVVPGDSGALGDAMWRVVARDAFPDHLLDPTAVAGLTRRHDVRVHVEWLRAVFAKVSS